MAKRKSARATGRKTAGKPVRANRPRSRAARPARKKVAARKSAARRARVPVRKGLARKGVPKRAAPKSAVRKVAGKRSAARRRAAGPPGKMARKATRKAAVPKTALPKATVPKVAVRKASVRKAPVPKAAVPKASVRQSPAPADRAQTSGARPAARTARSARKVPALDRERRVVRDDDIVPSPPSSLDLDRSASAARTGRREMVEKLHHHTESSPVLTGGDIDADWEGAYATGDEAPGGDNPTPDESIVDDIGKAIGVQYEDNEELKGEKKISDRDKKRWELDPASAEDYDDR